MIRKIQTAVLLAAAVFTSFASQVEAGCHGFSHCAPVYNDCRLTPRQAYILLKRDPRLAARFPKLMIQLEQRFGVRQTVAVTPAATPAATPVSQGGVVEQTTVVEGGATPAAGEVAAPAAGGGPIAGGGPVAGGGPAAAASPGPAPAATPDTPAGPNTPAAPGAPAGPDTPAAPGELPAGPGPGAQAGPGVPKEIEAILGVWQNISTDAQGQEVVTKINLESDGNATLTVDSGVGPISIKRPFSVANNEFTIGEGDEKLSLGKVVSAGADKVVIDRDGAELTFTRP